MTYGNARGHGLPKIHHRKENYTNRELRVFNRAFPPSLSRYPISSSKPALDTIYHSQLIQSIRTCQRQF